MSEVNLIIVNVQNVQNPSYEQMERTISELQIKLEDTVKNYWELAAVNEIQNQKIACLEREKEVWNAEIQRVQAEVNSRENRLKSLQQIFPEFVNSADGIVQKVSTLKGLITDMEMETQQVPVKIERGVKRRKHGSKKKRNLLKVEEL